MTITHTTDWRAYSAAGVLMATFGSADIAAAWVETAGATLPGHRVVRIRTRVLEEVISEDVRERVAA